MLLVQWAGDYAEGYRRLYDGGGENYYAQRYSIDSAGALANQVRWPQAFLERIDEIYCECSFLEPYDGQPMVSEVVAFLHAAGFALAGVFGLATALSGEQMQADLLFVNTRPPARGPVAPVRDSGAQG